MDTRISRVFSWLRPRLRLTRADKIFLVTLGVLIIAAIAISGAHPDQQSIPANVKAAGTMLSLTTGNNGSNAGSNVQAGTGFGGTHNASTGHSTSTKSTAQAPNLNVDKTYQKKPQACDPQHESECPRFGDSFVGMLIWTDPKLTYQNASVQALWWGVFGMCSGLLLIFIIINGFILMYGRGLSYSNAIEVFPRIIFAYAGAFLSIFFVACLIGVNNGICDQLQVIASQNGIGLPTGEDWGGLIVQILMFIVSLVVFIGGMFLAQTMPILGIIVAGLGAAGLALELLTLIVSIIVFIQFIMLFIQLVIRVAVLNLLIVFLPFIFLAKAAGEGGAGEQLYKGGMAAIFATIFVQPVQLLAFVGGSALFSGLPAWFQAAGFLGIKNASLQTLVILWLTLKVPQLMQNPAAGLMSEGSRGFSAALNQMFQAVQNGLSTYVLASR